MAGGLSQQDIQKLKTSTESLFVKKELAPDILNEAFLDENVNLQKHTHDKLSSIKESMKITVPKSAATVRPYKARGTQDNMSKSKRKTRSGMLGSALRTKRLNAEEIENANTTFENILREREKVSYPVLDELNIETDTKDAVKYLIDNFNASHMEEGYVNDDEIRSLSPESEVDSFDVINKLTKEFMTTDISDIDISSDQNLVKSAYKLESLSKTYESMKILLDAYPGYKDNLDEAARDILAEKMETIGNLSEYYQAKKVILTDELYRTSYNSELSYAYNSKDSIEKRNLTMKIIRADNALFKIKPGLALSKNLYSDMGDSENMKTQKKKLASKAYIGEDAKIKSIAADTIKNLVYSNDANKAVLMEKNYTLSGESQGMEVPIFKNIRSIITMKYISHCRIRDVEKIFLNLAKRPQNPEDPNEIESCKEANISGLKGYKEIIRDQIRYIKNKYGKGILNITPEEMNEHAEEIKQDLNCLEPNLAILKFCKEKEIFNQDEDDEKLLLECEYYEEQTRVLLNTMKSFRDEEISYVEAKINEEEILNNPKSKKRERNIDASNQNVMWDKIYDISNVTMEDFIDIISSNELFTKNYNDLIKYMNDNNLDFEIKWFNILPAMREMYQDEDTAVIKITKSIEDEAEMDSQRIPVYSDSVAISRILCNDVGGVGTEDMGMIQEGYLDLNAIKTAGLKDEEIEEYNNLLKEYSKVSQELSYASVCLENLDFDTKIAAPGQNQKIIKKQIIKAFKTKFENAEKLQQDKDDEKAKKFEELREFRAKHNLFIRKEHEKVYKDNVQTKIDKINLSEGISISGKEIKTAKVSEEMKDYDLSKLLAGKNISKENQEGFDELIEAYNKNLKEAIAIEPLLSAAEEMDFSQKEVWQFECKGKKFFAYDLSQRFKYLKKEMDSIKNKINEKIR